MRFQNALAFLVIIGMLLAVISIYQSGASLAKIEGPSSISVDPSGQVYVVSDRKVFVLHSDGTLLRTLHPDFLSVSSAISDLEVLSDGRLLISEAYNGDIRLCDSELEHCRILSGPLKRELGSLGKSANLAVDEISGVIFISDSGHHRLIAIDLDGNVIDATEKNGSRFVFPNDLMFQSSSLIAADTNNSRVVAIDVTGGRFGRDLWQFDARTDLAGSGRWWPMSIAQSGNGDWWVINAGAGMRHGVVLIFEQSGKAIRSVQLPSAPSILQLDSLSPALAKLWEASILGLVHDPLALAKVGDQILVTDPSLMRVVSITQDGAHASEFGDESFQAELRQLSERRQRLKLRRTGSMALAFALLMVAVPIAKRTKKQKSTQTESSARIAAVEQHIAGYKTPVTLRANLERARRLVLAYRTYGAALIAMPVIFGMLFPEFFASSSLRNLTFQSVVALDSFVVGALMLLMAVRISRFAKLTIVVALNAVHLIEFDGKKSSYPLSGIVFSERILRIGEQFFDLRSSGSGLFGPEELRAYIVNRLEKTAQVSVVELELRKLLALMLHSRAFVVLLIVLVLLPVVGVFVVRFL